MLDGRRLCTQSKSVFSADFFINTERQTSHSSAVVKIARGGDETPRLGVCSECELQMNDLCRKLATKCPDIAVKVKEKKK